MAKSKTKARLKGKAKGKTKIDEGLKKVFEDIETEIPKIIDNVSEDIMEKATMGILDRDMKIQYLSNTLIDLHMEIEELLENRWYYDNRRKRKEENQFKRNPFADKYSDYNKFVRDQLQK